MNEGADKSGKLGTLLVVVPKESPFLEHRVENTLGRCGLEISGRCERSRMIIGSIVPVEEHFYATCTGVEAEGFRRELAGRVNEQQMSKVKIVFPLETNGL